MKLLKNIAIAACIIISVSAQAQHKTAKKVVHALPPAPPAPPVKVVDPNAEFLSRNKDVKSVKWEPGTWLVIEKSDGGIERYQVDKFHDEQQAKSVYGKLPPMPAPVRDHSAPTSYNPNKPNK